MVSVERDVPILKCVVIKFESVLFPQPLVPPQNTTSARRCWTTACAARQRGSGATVMCFPRSSCVRSLGMHLSELCLVPIKGDPCLGAGKWFPPRNGRGLPGSSPTNERISSGEPTFPS
ncbi:unnamed protein product, partial [Trypanosoma congolense IL3000]